MDIEKLKRCLKCCADDNSKACNKCELEYGEEECQNLCGYAATALSALQAENEKLRAELEQTKLEKETLIEAVRGDCDYCKNDLGNLDEKSPCRHCEGFAAKEFVTGDYWQWRGPEEEIKNG